MTLIRDLNRRSLLVGAASLTAATAVFGVRRSHAAAEFSFRMANNQQLTHPTNIRLKEAVDAIRTQTDGRVEIEVFPNSQLGADTDMLSQLRSGAVQFFHLSGVILSTMVPAASINGVGFAFPDYPAVWKAMDGDLGAYVRAQIEAAGLIPMAKIWDNGFRQITTSNKPIQTPADLENFKIRVPVSPLWTSMFKAFGSAPTSINFAETYSALQTRVVDGQENPLAIVETAKLFEVQTFCSTTNHMWDGFWLLANRRALASLPDDVRTIVETQFNEAAIKERADVEALNGTIRATLETQGMTFNDPDPAAFRDKLRSAGFYEEWKANYGEEAWGILEGAVGKLG